MYKRRQNINSLFGSYHVARDTGIFTYNDEDDTDNSIKNFISKETKVGNELLSNHKIMMHQEDPDGYKEFRGIYANQQSNIFRDKWKNEFRSLLNRGYTQNEAIKMTDKSLGKLKEELYKDIIEEYPYF